MCVVYIYIIYTLYIISCTYDNKCGWLEND